MKIRGVNVGNWLVLEKWMKPELFDGVLADDEAGLWEALPRQELLRRLNQHRREYVTQDDFARLSRLNCNLVRIPVPHTIFQEPEGLLSGVSCLDAAFAWAQECGIQVLIDLHTVPGGQNGFDNSGTSGLCTWHLKPQNRQQTLEVLRELGKRYGHHPALFGIEPMNEPANEFIFQMNMKRYGAAHPERVQVSQVIPKEELCSFYCEVYDQVMPLLHSDAVLVLHDRFEPDGWADFMPRDTYPRVWLDTHMYLNFSEHRMKARNEEAYLTLIQREFAATLARASQYHPVLVGEWCLGQHMDGLRDMGPEEQAKVYRSLGRAQMQVWGQVQGGVFWNVKNDAPGRADWSFFQAVDNGWLSYQECVYADKQV